MNKYTYNFVWVFGFFLSLGWAIYTIFSSWGTACFSFFNTYSTILVLLFNLIWSNFIKYEENGLE